MIKKFLRNIKKILDKYSKIKYFILKIIPQSIIKKIILFYTQKDYIHKIIYTKNKKIFFSLESLSDGRGIGRVTKEYINNLQKLTKFNKKDYNLPEVYFYSSIHFAPDKLPENSVVMIHDVIPMIFPDLFPEVVQVWRDKYYNIAQQAVHIITISQTSKNDIIKYLDIKAEKISIVNNGVTKLNKTKAIKNFILPPKYFVYIGSFDNHKNLTVVLKALSLLDNEYKLLMIGNNILAKDEVKKLNIKNKVDFLGRLSDDEMAYIVKNSIALLFPSLYEGFGLPPMEAALLKVPSICSNRPTMTEFLEDVALFADVNSAEEWSKQMITIANDKELREDIAQKAYKRVSQFNWEDSSKRLLSIIDGLD